MSGTRVKVQTRGGGKSIASVPVTKILAALEAVRKANGGKLIPEQVVESARPQSSVLHPIFEWDDKKAGDAWRLHQARNLIREVEIIKPDGPAAAYINVSVKEGRYYKPPEVIINDMEEYLSACGMLKTYITGAQRTLDHLRELAGRLKQGEKQQRLLVAHEALLAAKAAVEMIQ